MPSIRQARLAPLLAGNTVDDDRHTPQRDATDISCQGTSANISI
jgi:hypothetical protein